MTTVKELIEELQKHNPESIVVITRPIGESFEYVNDPKVHTRKNMFGERTWID